MNLGLSIYCNFIIGVMGGIIAGFIVSRIIEFNTLKIQAIEIINSAETLTNKPLQEYVNDWESRMGKLLSISCIMLRNKHKNAGITILNVLEMLRNKIYTLEEKDLEGQTTTLVNNRIIVETPLNFTCEQKIIEKIKPRY